MYSPSRYVYVPASAQASRSIIEHSSYTTTPSQSPGTTPPPCGEIIYKQSLATAETIDDKLILKKLSATAKGSILPNNADLDAGPRGKDLNGGLEDPSVASETEGEMC